MMELQEAKAMLVRVRTATSRARTTNLNRYSVLNGFSRGLDDFIYYMECGDDAVTKRVLTGDLEYYERVLREARENAENYGSCLNQLLGATASRQLVLDIPVDAEMIMEGIL